MFRGSYPEPFHSTARDRFLKGGSERFRSHRDGGDLIHAVPAVDLAVGHKVRSDDERVPCQKIKSDFVKTPRALVKTEMPFRDNAKFQDRNVNGELFLHLTARRFREGFPGFAAAAGNIPKVGAGVGFQKDPVFGENEAAGPKAIFVFDTERMPFIS